MWMSGIAVFSKVARHRNEGIRSRPSMRVPDSFLAVLSHPITALGVGLAMVMGTSRVKLPQDPWPVEVKPRAPEVSLGEITPAVRAETVGENAFRYVSLTPFFHSQPPGMNEAAKAYQTYLRFRIAAGVICDGTSTPLFLQCPSSPRQAAAQTP
jgi:hypothetical protein